MQVFTFSVRSNICGVYYEATYAVAEAKTPLVSSWCFYFGKALGG